MPSEPHHTLTLYNTLTRRKEALEPITPGRVGIYACGPTVYSEPHLGHARGPIVMDVLRRWLEHRGLKVRYVSNVTDVGHLTDDADQGEDKLQKRAKLEQLEPMEVAEKYFWEYFDALDALNVLRPDIVPRASGHIPEQIELTQQLIATGLAYERNGSVYFDVSALASYGELSGRNPEDLLEGTRIEVRSDKDDPRDFALWKRAEPEHLMRWNSPWGAGYPGWHIECTVMSTKYLGDHFDIHGGGLDLIFPHHESEIAQAKGAGKPFANVWLHWNFITLEGEKMARSKNHFVTLEALFAHHDPMTVRFHLLRSHYRSVSDFSEESLLGSAQGLKRLRETHQEAARRAGGAAPSEAGRAALAAAEAAFAAALDDDLNTPQAIAALFDAARDVNSRLSTEGPGYAAAARDFFEAHLGTVLGVTPTQGGPAQDGALMDGLIALISEQRQRARLERDFTTSDALRERLAELGVVLEDTADGVRWKRG